VKHPAGRIDILVNHAAVMPIGLIEEHDVSTFEQILAVNLLAAIVFSKYCIPHIRRARGMSPPKKICEPRYAKHVAKRAHVSSWWK
jgi:NAD(P)-dependent dehydrogenase (short-subunit alcohol dehydrogenase family)